MTNEYKDVDATVETGGDASKKAYQDGDVKVKIHFTGLCAIVPQREIENPHNEATILLVDASRSPHGVHHTLLLVDPQSYPREVANRNAESKIYYDKPPVEPVTVCTLGTEVLTVVGRDADGARVAPARESLQFITGRRLPGECPRGGNFPDVTWIARHPGTLNRQFLNTLDPKSPVSVRMSLTQGTMATGGFRQNERGVVCWKYGPGIPAPLAEEAVYTLNFPATSRIRRIVLESTPFENTPEQRDIHLVPQAGNLEAWIVNLPLAGLLGLPPRRYLDPDHHFAEFRRLCADNPELLIPTPDPTRYCGKLIDPTNPKCPPTLFLAVGDVATPSSRGDGATESISDHHLGTSQHEARCPS